MSITVNPSSQIHLRRPFENDAMALQDRAVQTDRERGKHLKFYKWIFEHTSNIITSLILPLMLGILTVVIANNQHKEVIRQQERDVKLRGLEIEIENNRNELQWRISDERYRDELLITYTKDVVELLKGTKDSLTSNPLLAALARAKTFNTIRQLDGLRASNVIRFLYEAGQLTTTENMSALRISGLVLNNVANDIFSTDIETGRLSLRGVLLQNSTFTSSLLEDVDLSSAQLKDIDISHSGLRDVQISFGKLTHISFSSAQLDSVKAIQADFTITDFGSAILTDVDLSSSHVINVNFSCARLDHVNLSSSTLKSVNFFSLQQRIPISHQRDSTRSISFLHNSPMSR